MSNPHLPAITFWSESSPSLPLPSFFNLFSVDTIVYLWNLEWTSFRHPSDLLEEQGRRSASGDVEHPEEGVSSSSPPAVLHSVYVVLLLLFFLPPPTPKSIT